MNSLCSMTGFGLARGQAAGWRVGVECRSVNHRALDARVFLPNGAGALEAPVLELVRERVDRGRVEIRIDVQPDGSDVAGTLGVIDEARFIAILRELKELARAHALPHEPTLSDVLTFRCQMENDGSLSLDEGVQQTLMACVEQALDDLVSTRRVEGAGIAADLTAHLDDITGNLQALDAIYPEEQEAFRGRLQDRVRQAMERFEIDEIDLGAGRLAQELVYYGERSDVSEEIQRAQSHLGKLRELFEGGQDAGAVGKTIDFYLQELIRETNTMASKSNSAALTDRAVAMKTSIEKMREQAANVE
ncbi:MAG: YicC/YloC family endoribonuclease [Bradymonadaceae bacterium]